LCICLLDKHDQRLRPSRSDSSANVLVCGVGTIGQAFEEKMY
jgi:hypothetical protein